jgi:TolB-like protein/DNA-binding winged helix-turn-helix (wHTH) protein/Flp pilus assembly protein TadD
MPPSNPPSHVIRFGVFELDTASGELRRHGLKIRLPDQSFQVLQLLLGRPGEVVTREELRRALWTAETFVDFDVGLNSAIRRVRDALDDSAENPRFVETLPRRGYRFIGSVNSPVVDRITEPDPVTATPMRSAARGRWVAGALLVVVIATLGVIFYQLERGHFWRRGAGTTAAPIQSLVVLPFANLTGDAAHEFFAEAVTDALTTQLAQVDGLDVISGTSARQYKRSTKRLPAIGKELNVDAALEGTVVRTGDRVRINAQLIHAATDRHVWARTYDDELSGILTLQQRIASDVAAAAGRAPAASAASRRGRPVDSQAYEAYLKGTKEVESQRYDRFRVAVAYFEEAVVRQPDFAEAYAALAQTQVLFLFGGPLSPRETMPKAEAAARKAIELDDTLVVAHRALGQVLILFYWKWDEGEKEFRRAAELSGGSDVPSGAASLSLIRRGRFADALAQAERARRRDPLSFSAQINVGTAYRAAGQHDQAIVEFRRALATNRDPSRAHFQLGVTHVAMKRIDDAIRELEVAARLPRQLESRLETYLGYAYAVAGRPLDARRVLNTLESRRRGHYVSSFGIALIHDALGEKERAIGALERAYEDRAVELAQISQFPAFKTIASEPRFQAVMRQIGLVR